MYLCGSSCPVDFLTPSVDDWLAIDVVNEGHQALLEFVFGTDADMAQHRTRQLGEEALDEIECPNLNRIGCAAGRTVS